MKKAGIFLLIFLVTLSSLFPEKLTHTSLKYEYEEYKSEEFPIWTRELRRGEILFFGSYVFSIPIAGLSLTALRSVNAIPSASSTEKDALLTLSVATGISLFVATLDWVIGKIQN